MNNADLLEKLDMIREAVERNPDEWWRELEFEMQRSGDMLTCDSPNDVWRAFHYGQTVRPKPQAKWVEGWVDNEVITYAKELRFNLAEGYKLHNLAKALLQLVKEEGDGE